jgi:UDP-N-acetyl-2-amino-2-deoxyglucuronate dehydrogenase
MKKNKLGVAIIGCGIISSSHVKAYQAFNDQCEIKAVCDLVPEKASQLASTIGEGVMVYTDFKEMLSREDIHVVSVCTPPFAHKEAVIETFKANKHVLCEKPLAASLEDCDEMIAAAKNYDKKLAVSFQYRFRKDFNQVKHLINRGSLNPLTFGQLNGLYWRGDSYYEVDWRGKWDTECGGVTINHEIHLLDVFLWLMGDIESVSAEIETVSHDIEVEDVSMAVIKFTNGSVGQVNGTVSSAIGDVSMSISGKSKGVSIPLKFHALKENEGGFPVQDQAGIEELEKIANEIQDGTIDHTGPVNDLFTAIYNNVEPIVNGQEGRKVIEAITAIYKSATTGQRINIPISKTDPWYTTEGLQRLVKKGKQSNLI